MWCPAGRPAGVRRLDVFCDYSAFPVWGPEMVAPERLGISAGLTEALAGWAGEWERRFGVGTGWDAEDPAGWAVYRTWFASGQRLAARLAVETGAAVVYQWPSGPDGAIPPVRAAAAPPGGRRRPAPGAGLRALYPNG